MSLSRMAGSSTSSRPRHVVLASRSGCRRDQGVRKRTRPSRPVRGRVPQLIDSALVGKAERRQHTARMLRNCLAAALRHANRNRAFTMLGVVGLAVGLATALLAALVLRHEYGFDHHIADHER